MPASGHDVQFIRMVEQYSGREMALSLATDPAIAASILAGNDPAPAAGMGSLIQPIILNERAGVLLDAILNETDRLIAAGRFGEAMGRLVTWVQGLVRTSSEHGASLEGLAERVEQFRDRLGTIARGVGAQSFSIEFSISIPPALTFCFHFDAPAAGTDTLIAPAAGAPSG